MFKRRFRLPSPALVIAMVALSLVLGGTAVAASTAKHSDAKADTKLVKKLAPTLSVKHAKTANSAATAANATHATTANSATNATNATHATSADGLTTLPSGQSESGLFAAGSGSEDVPSTQGWIGTAITYPRPLAAPIPDGQVIEVDGVGPVTHCAGPGHADAGYLCMYDAVKSGVGGASIGPTTPARTSRHRRSVFSHTGL